MAFERIAIETAKAKAAAGITITHTGKTVIALSKDIVARVGFKAKDTFSASIGTDEDAGKLRIEKSKDGVACARELARTGAFFFKLGVVPPIGVTPHKQRPIEARVVDGGVEFEIPPDDGPKLLPAPAKMPANKEVAATGGGARRAKGDGGETINGVSIDLTLDAESISFKGKSIEVTTRQAKFVRLLAKPRPSPVGDAFLIGALWDGRPPANAKDQLRTMTADLKGKISSIKLSISEVKGVGYQLKDA